MVLRREEGTDFAECNTASGKIRMWVLAPSVYVTQGEGHMQDDHAQFLELQGTERIRRAGGKLYVFHDWMEMTGYDSKTRVRLTTWSASHRHVYQEVHPAVRSRIVSDGRPGRERRTRRLHAGTHGYGGARAIGAWRELRGLSAQRTLRNGKREVRGR